MPIKLLFASLPHPTFHIIIQFSFTKLLQSRWDDEGGLGPTIGGPGSQKLEGGATATTSQGSSKAWKKENNTDCPSFYSLTLCSIRPLTLGMSLTMSRTSGERRRCWLPRGVRGGLKKEILGKNTCTLDKFFHEIPPESGDFARFVPILFIFFDKSILVRYLGRVWHGAKDERELWVSQLRRFILGNHFVSPKTYISGEKGKRISYIICFTGSSLRWYVEYLDGGWRSKLPYRGSTPHPSPPALSSWSRRTIFQSAS